MNGPSVTNAAEDIASQVYLRYGLDPERTIFVEHVRTVLSKLAKSRGERQSYPTLTT